MTIDDLPDEVLIQIFGYLVPREILRLNSVCRRWSRLIKQSPLMKNYIISFYRNDFDKNHPFVKHVLETNYVYPNIRLSHTNMMEELTKFWTKLGPTLSKLILIDRMEAFENFNYSVLFLKAFNIERLELNVYLEHEKAENLNLNFQQIDGLKYMKLKELILFGTITLSWISFFDRSAPNLTYLELCQTTNSEESTIATCSLLDKRRKQIKTLILHLVNTQEADYGFDMAMQLLENSRLQLETFKFFDSYYTSATVVDRTKLIEFIRRQKHLLEIEIFINTLEEFESTTLSPSLTKLTLSLNFSDSILLKNFNCLTNLQELSIKVGQSGVLYFSDLEVNGNMQKLQLQLNGGQKVTKRITNIIASCYPNLTNLRMNNCNSNCLPAVFGKLQKLSELCISVDIIDSKNDLDEIINLKNLKVLLLRNLNNILNDNILIDKFHFSKLQRLEFIDSGEHITDIGIIGLALKSPLIKNLCLKDFNKITDKAIEFISCNMRLLEELNIEGCRALTCDSINYISVRCKNIRYITRDF